MKYDTRPWPGDPGAAWTAAIGAPPLERPPAPDATSSFERFTELVEVEATTRFNGWMNIMLGCIGAVMLCFVGDFRSRIDELGLLRAFFLGDVWYRNAMAFAMPLFLVGGAFAVAYGPKVHARRVRRLYERARTVGIMGLAYPSGYRIPHSEETSPVSVVLEPRIGDLQAGRLLRAVSIWLAGLEQGSKAKEAFNVRLGSYRTVRTEAIFGPEAAGGFVRSDPLLGSPTPWRILLPDAKEVRAPYGHWDVLQVQVRVEAEE
ncbi:hypothetical protein [Glycomyces sp. NRRL B-16210]|uniref:hypothetical protein n=1 Tax=Glycomyces sp. NRRL B-16210 TaxID=1463821 RepID=UPI0004C0813F|nr:hypothetical protein [Glycomyces sp. NRRL B-16210]